MRGALTGSVCAYLSRPTRALVCAGMQQLPALAQQITHTARIQASSTDSPLFFRARISKMLSVWALVASRLTRPWHPYGHRWSHRTGPCTAPSSTPWLQRKHTQIQWVPMLTLCTASNLLRAVQSCLSEVHTFRWTGHLVSRDMAVCQRTNYRDVERMAQIAVRITR